MKNQCDSKDYDFYTFGFPLKAFSRGKPDKYICSQLEIMHPCFSDACCFDYKLRLEKKQLKADVVVMQKYILAEYRNKRKKIVIPERRRTVFFSSVKPVKVVTAFFAAASVFAAVILIWTFVVHGKETDENVGLVNQQYEQTENLYVPACKDAVVLLEKAVSLGGTSDFFSWESDGFTEKTSLSLHKIFPEQIMDFLPQAEFSPVYFVWGSLDVVPQMTVQLIQRVKNGFEYSIKTASKGKTELRNYLLLQQEEILEETVKPDAIKFSLCGDLKDKTEKVLAVINEKQIYVSSLVIKKQGDEVLFEIIFSDMEMVNQGKLIQTLMNSVSLFFEELVQSEEGNVEKPVKTSGMTKRSAASEQPAAPGQEQMTLVGKIIHGNGSVTEYYKNQLGKIIKKER